MFKYFNNQPITTLAFASGVCLNLIVADTPSSCWLIISTMLLLGMIIRFPSKFATTIFAIYLGFVWMACHINHHLSTELPYAVEGQLVQISGTIISIPEQHGLGLKFNFKVQSLQHASEHWPAPGVVQLSWYHSKQRLTVGDSWSLYVKLKRPRAFANPGGFDTEKYFFQQRIYALGVVNNKQPVKLIASKLSSQPINRLRQHLLEIITDLAGPEEFFGIITALILGIKSYIPIQQLTVLRDTGTAHLMAISGLHIGLLAATIFFVIKITYRKLLFRYSITAPIIAALVALIITISYALLAGFAIATQRALIMVIVMLWSILARRKVTIMQGYCFSMLGVLCIDPFAVMSVGFWLSFIAVALLLIASVGVTGITKWCKPQLALLFGMLPLTALYFQQITFIAPLANLIAIPIVSIIIVPLLILAIVTMMINFHISKILLLSANNILHGLWYYLEHINHLHAVYVTASAAPIWLVVCAIIGSFWLFAPRGIPGRYWGLLPLLAIFIPKTSVLEQGQLEFTLLDVGQGLAAVIKTKNHVLVYDTGPGPNIVWPFLKSQGISKINTLMISHADKDHIGGAKGLLQHIMVEQVLTSDTNALLTHQPQQCVIGQHWQWDGVDFKVLHPPNLAIVKKNKNNKRNNNSCVLLVQSSEQRLLLTGDIEAVSEQLLVKNFAKQLAADILVVPHHGSKSSSSLEFIKAVQPQYAIISVGHINQYGHPKQQVLSRYQSLDINILTTAEHGAILFKLAEKHKKILPRCYRIEHSAFWRE